MEDDDDEFGDLYTDVLRPSSQSAPVFSSNPSPPPKLPLQTPHSATDDDEDILYAPQNKPNLPPSSSHSTPPTQALESTVNESDSSDAAQDLPKQRSPLPISEEKEPPRVSNSPIPGSPQDGGIGVSGESAAAEHDKDRGCPVEVEEEKPAARVSDTPPVDLDLNQDGGAGASEIDIEIGDLDADPVIPGLSTGPGIPGISHSEPENRDVKGSALRKENSSGGGDDDWESDDSEDDLQIVLNDNSGPIGLERNDDEDEDGEDLVIVADGDQHRPEIEDQEWGEEPGQTAADGERKEAGETGKVNGGVMVPGGVGARIGYSGHGYHPNHSQFKYVRPGAASAALGGGVPGQVRPHVTMNLVTGRGRGDWRAMGINKNIPIMQKPFNSGFGFPGWANNSSGRNGFEFTLPSHKTVFDVDIDAFEEKPWRHPGVDLSDYFNFGLDEDNWKGYCKQLVQFRLESTMQSKIRVYESGRSEQDYDPDLPPELAAAAGHHDVAAENATLGKTDIGQADLMGQGRGANRMRPPIPTGRAIQVEGGSGERLPSIDTRQPRHRDTDAIIEIVLQDSLDDDSITSNGTLDRQQNGLQAEDLQGGHETEENDRPPDPGYFDHFPPTYNNRKREIASRRAPFIGSVQNNMQEGDGILPFPSEAPLQYHPGSKARPPIYAGGPYGSPQGGRWPPGTSRERYSHTTSEQKNDVIPSHSARNKFDVHQKEEKSGDSIELKHTLEASSPAAVEVARDESLDHKDDMPDEERLALADSVEGEEMGSDMGIPSETLADDNMLHTVKKQKLSSRVEQPATLDVGSGDDVRTTLSDNSKAKSGSSRDYQKRQDGGEEEVMQDGRSRRMVDSKRRYDEDESVYRRRDDYSRISRHEMDRSRMVTRGREDLYHSYPHRDRDSGSSHYARAKTDGFERGKERDNSVGAWQRRDEETHGRRVKDEDIKRRERVEETGSRHRRLHENDRNDKDSHPNSRKRVDEIDWRGRPDRDGGPRQRERDDALMGRHENLNDPHKRRKEEDLQRREHVDKEDVLHSYRAREDSSRRKRERDESADQRRREDQVRSRDKPDDHHSSRHREESWRQREREDKQRLKQSHEDAHTRREREEVRGTIRSGRALDDKQLAGNPRVKDESKGLGSEKDYQLKDRRRESEQPKRRDRAEEETSSQHGGHDDAYSRENQSSNEDRNPRHERSSTHSDRPVSTSDNQQGYKERHRDNARKGKEFEGGDQSTLLPSKRKHDEHSTHRNEKVSSKSTGEQETGHASMTGQADSRDRSQSRSSSAVPKKSHNYHHEQHEAQRHSSRKHGEDAASDDEHQSNLKRGRSKLERWASHKEPDISATALSPSSASKGKESGGRNHNNRSSLASEQADGLAKTGEAVDNQHQSGVEENAGDSEPKDTDMAAAAESQHVDSERVGDDRHLDTVAKLRKRSERFKLPMPSEKETHVNRKMENEVVLAQTEAAADAEIKQERPARKRRWVGS